MRRAATSSNALRLPSQPAVTLEVVRDRNSDRQRVVRHGIFITHVGSRRRMVYQQLDGEIILADECKCRVDWPEVLPENWPVSFVIERRFDCPIDEHKRQQLDAEEAW